MRRGSGNTTQTIVMTVVLALGIGMSILSILMSVGPSLHSLVQFAR